MQADAGVPFIKICGITRAADARHAVEHGATALGFVFWPRSPRRVTAAQAAAIVSGLPPSVTTVGVFVNETPDRLTSVMREAGLQAVQLHGEESAADGAGLPWPLFRSATLEDAEGIGASWPAGTTLLLDAFDPVRRGGTGLTIDWSKAAALARMHRVVLAGGLTPANVAQAIATVRPFGVDVSSGVEESPGIKDAKRVAAFLARARMAFDERQETR